MSDHPYPLAAMLAKQLPPNDPVDALKPADMSYWSRMPTWTNSEGISLIFGKDPEFFTPDWAKMARQISTKAAQFDKYMEMTRRAVETGDLLYRNIPGHFLDWAETRVEGARALKELMKAAGLPVVDWRLAYAGCKAKLDTITTERDLLLEQLNDRTAETSPLSNNDASHSERAESANTPSVAPAHPSKKVAEMMEAYQKLLSEGKVAASDGQKAIHRAVCRELGKSESDRGYGIDNFRKHVLRTKSFN